MEIKNLNPEDAATPASGTNVDRKVVNRTELTEGDEGEEEELDNDSIGEDESMDGEDENDESDDVSSDDNESEEDNEDAEEKAFKKSK